MVVLGGPTFREVSQLIKDINSQGQDCFEVIGLLDDDQTLHGRSICGVNVLGPLGLALDFSEDIVFALAINNYKRRIQRIEIINKLGLPHNRFPALIHPTGVMDDSTQVGYGSQVFQFCTAAHGVKIGKFCMLSPFSLFALDAWVDNGVLTGARVTVLGGVRLGECSFLGSGSIITEKVVIGQGALVGAGSLVQKDVKPGHFTMGYPASKQIRNIPITKDILK